jgi:Mlc titration factor MtfA (ptsG expression regulator)
MNIALWVLLLLMLGGVVSYALVTRRLLQRRIHALKRSPLPDAWHAILERNVPVYGRLPSALKQELQGFVMVFLATKQFKGAGGLEVDDEMRVTIAGQACILLLNRDAACYPKLRTVIVHRKPYAELAGDAFTSARNLDDSVVEILGKSHGGMVEVAWDEAKLGARLADDGNNVTFHEFAHQLDRKDGILDGVPVHPDTHGYGPWAAVLSKEFGELHAAVAADAPRLMQDYGATDPVEFFAVATETFFERPAHMQRRHPELYTALKDFYRVDPVSW